MKRNWESVFSQWASPPGTTEEQRCENAIRAIRNAVINSEKLRSRGVKVFVQGSYRNRVNVRQESDVDVGVLCYDYFLSYYPPGKAGQDFGNIDAPYTYSQFKDELGEALVNYFGHSAVTRGNKAFDIHETSYHVDADATPFFEYRRYNEDGSYLCGAGLLPDTGGRIINYPERLLDTWPLIDQHYENGVSKNKATSRTFKGAVRILKRLRNEMKDKGIASAEPIPGFLIECLVSNVPNYCFSGSSWEDIVRTVIIYLWSNTKTDEACKEWTEVNDIKYLFHTSQKWTRAQAYAFIDEAWSYIGV